MCVVVFRSSVGDGDFTKNPRAGSGAYSRKGGRAHTYGQRLELWGFCRANSSNLWYCVLLTNPTVPYEPSPLDDAILPQETCKGGIPGLHSLNHGFLRQMMGSQRIL